MIKNRIIYNHYTEYAFQITRAEESYIWADGRKMIDFTSGWNTTNLGWNHPEVAEAVAAQVRKNSYSPMWAADPVQEAYAAALTGALRPGLAVAGRATGGTEANEMAIKTARAFTGRRKIVGFRETYHGQSASTLAIGFPHDYVKGIAAMVGDYTQLPYPGMYRAQGPAEQVLKDFEDGLRKALAGRDVAAVVAEAGIITGWGSTGVAPAGYVGVIRRLTKEHGTLMILDEVGTGFSRCGKLFGAELDGGVTPDVTTLAKGITNGAAAMGAMVTTQEIGEATYAKGLLISTFGWTPVACAAALKVLEIHQRDRVWEKAARDGEYLMGRLRKELADHPLVGDVRGKGMEIGIDIVKDKKTKEKNPEAVTAMAGGAIGRGLHVVCDSQSNIQLMPPLTIERAVLDEGLGRLIESIKAVGA